MQYEKAFRRLGYSLDNVRQDWSAEKADGVCVTLWKKEVNWRSKPPYVDLWELHPDGGDWESLPGHRKRTAHISKAMDDHGGHVDAIIVTGEPGESYGTAHVWEPEERQDHTWRITKFNCATGYFRAEATPRKSEG